MPSDDRPNRKLLKQFSSIIGIVLFGLAVWVLYRELRGYAFDEVLAYIAALPATRLLLAFALMATSYIALMGNDALAVRYAGKPLPFRKTALASFVGYTFSSTIGHALVTGGAVRYRLYSSWGLSNEQISKVIVFCSLSFWVGLCVLGGVLFIFDPPVTPEALDIRFPLPAVGVVLLLLISTYFVLGFFHRSFLKVRGWRIHPPRLKYVAGQSVVASVDLLATASVLYTVLPPAIDLAFSYFLGIFLLAILAGVISHVPGGLGVFDTVVVLLLTPFVPPPQVFGSLLVYRSIYYILPLAIASALLALTEVRQHVAMPDRKKQE